MTQSNLIAIDLAKNIFQVAQLKGNKLKFNKSMKREPMREGTRARIHQRGRGSTSSRARI